MVEPASRCDEGGRPANQSPDTNGALVWKDSHQVQLTAERLYNLSESAHQHVPSAFDPRDVGLCDLEASSEFILGEMTGIT